MKRYYVDVLNLGKNLGKNLGAAMPHLSSLCEKIERYPTHESAKTCQELWSSSARVKMAA